MIEQFCYYAGVVTVDIVTYSVFGQGAFMAYSSLKLVAKNHKIITHSVDAVSENLFECLQYID